MASSSTSSVQKFFTYDVFLSFRGEDTRKNFVGHLYDALERQGIQTFKDDEELRKGERISNELIQSIEDSKFFIIVFSKNYASSSWCLEELVKIMECQKTPEQKAYPLFYDVEPTDIRKQRGAVGEAFSKHKHQVAAGRWREVLKEAANLSGWNLRETADGDEAKLIKKVVEEISLELCSVHLSVDEMLVGMESRIKDVESILEIDSDEIRMIGIKGMGGVGKTTLAWAVFAKICTQFDGTSFVENVREVSNNPLSGLKSLQEQVLSDVLQNKEITVRSVPYGKSLMKSRLRCKKVVVVLDDVDHIDQLEALAGDPSWFKPGSRIIITTRDEQVLKSRGVNLIHDVNLLSDEEANCLFSRYAFGKEIPNTGYEKLSRQVVRYAAGLPLTVRVLGSFLCTKEKHEWKDALERLKKIPLEEILKKLELSYISLENDYKEIFLDVACFLKGSRKDEAIRMLDSCGYSAINGLRVLEQKSLITIKVDQSCEYLSMHDHLEEMGRNIVRREHPEDPNKHSRLWIFKEIENVLANNLGNETTRCIKAYGKLRLSPETFMEGLGSMKKLRALDVKLEVAGCRDWKFDEVRPYLPNALQYLRWDFYPFQSLPETFQADNLVGLVVRCSGIVQLWKGGKRKVLHNLKYLDLSFLDLKTLDLLTPNLQQLRLEECHELVELQMPIGCQELISMELSHLKLKTLDLGLTPNLKRLTLTNCYVLGELRMHNNGCPKLKDLQVLGSMFKALDLGLNSNLEILTLTYCDVLVELRMHNNGCPKLAFLQIFGSKLKTLDLKLTLNLKGLCLINCDELVELHMPINGYLELTDLAVTGSKLKTLDLTRTPKLKFLHLVECHELVELHMDINGCPDLTNLLVTGTNLKTLDLTRTPKLK